MGIESENTLMHAEWRDRETESRKLETQKGRECTLSKIVTGLSLGNRIVSDFVCLFEIGSTL